MKSRTYKIFISLHVLLSVILPSCHKFLEVDPPKDKIISEKVFANDQLATAAVVGLYGRMMETMRNAMNGSISICAALSADEIVNTNSDPEIDQFATNSLQSNNNIVKSQLWDALYNYIYHANACIEGISASPTLSSNTSSQLIGEAKFIRATCYFYLANMFGDVPLLFTTDYRVNAIAPRETQSKVFSQVVDDLKEAEAHLSESYQNDERTRPNRFAAAALLARVYLQLKEYDLAVDQATLVINSGLYSLASNLTDVFTFQSTETIWQMETITGSYRTAEGNTFVPYPATTKPAYIISPTLLNSFEPSDGRKTAWINNSIVGADTFYYPFKYQVKFAFLSPRKEYNIVLRLAEVLLIRAEAKTRLNITDEARADLNAVRNRAGLNNSQATDQASMLDAIERERRVELFTEFGHRWFDLSRTQRADYFLQTLKSPNWHSFDTLYPIPFTQLQLNPNLTQNQGY